MQDAERELRRRRERGKVAQRAFRQRQSVAVERLKEEHESLKSLVTQIVDAARADDPAQSKAAIIKAGHAVGLDVTGLAAENRNHSSAEAEDPSTSLRCSVGLPVAQGPYLDSPCKQTSRVEQDICARGDTTGLHSFSHPYDQSGRMSPRFDYGLWLDLGPNPDRCLKIFHPPFDIVPYLGAGMRTVAGKILWGCMDYAFDSLREVCIKQPTNSIQPCQRLVDYPPSLPPNSAARAFFDSALRHSKPLHDVPYLAAMAEARIEFRKFGCVRGDHPGVNAESMQVLHRRILEDFLERGVRRDEWWSPLQLERYIEEKMGFYEFDAFQTAISFEEGSGLQMEVLRPLTLALAQNAICFGDGPRWKSDYAVWAVNAWISAIGRFRVDEDFALS